MSVHALEGDWRYVFRCLDCQCDYEKRPTMLVLGPIYESKPGNLVTVAKDTPTYEVVNVYNGPISLVSCGECLLRIHFPPKLATALWDRWLEENRRVIEDDAVLKGYVGIAQFISQEMIGFPDALGSECLRCGGVLHTGISQRHCPQCGSRQVNLIRSERIPNSPQMNREN